MTRIRTTDQYRDEFRSALSGSDPAMVQDALYDLDEFLRSERAANSEDLSEQELVARAIEGFGTPEEVAASYRETEGTVTKALATPTPGLGITSGVFGVIGEPKAYGALFLMLFSLVTGILYFTWVAVGLAMSIGFSILIIGIPFLIGFAVSLRMLGLMEGRMLEALTGVRMPRRPVSLPSNVGWAQNVKYWVTDRRTWSTLLYCVLSLPLGVLGFALAVTLLSLALSLFAVPFAQLFTEWPMITIGSMRWYVQWWLFPFFWLASVFVALVLLHLARLFGGVRAGLARALLVA